MWASLALVSGRSSLSLLVGRLSSHSAHCPAPQSPPTSSWLAYHLFLLPILPGTCQFLGWRMVLDYPARQVILAPEFALVAAWLPVGAGSVVGGESTEKEDLCCPLGLSPLQRQWGVVRTGMDGVATLPEMRLGGRTVRWEHMPTWSC